MTEFEEYQDTEHVPLILSTTSPQKLTHPRTYLHSQQHPHQHHRHYSLTHHITHSEQSFGSPSHYQDYDTTLPREEISNSNINNIKKKSPYLSPHIIIPNQHHHQQQSSHTNCNNKNTDNTSNTCNILNCDTLQDSNYREIISLALSPSGGSGFDNQTAGESGSTQKHNSNQHNKLNKEETVNIEIAGSLAHNTSQDLNLNSVERHNIINNINISIRSVLTFFTHFANNVKNVFTLNMSKRKQANQGHVQKSKSKSVSSDGTEDNHIHSKDSNSNSNSNSHSWGIPTVLRGIGMIILIILLIYCVVYKDIIYEEFGRFLNWVEKNPGQGAIGYIIVYALSAIFCIPAVILTLGSGYIFSSIYGGYIGLIIACIVDFGGATAGAFASFIICKVLFYNCVTNFANNKFSKQYNALQILMEKEDSLKLLVLMRVVMPYNLLNYLLGVTNVSIMAYGIANIGMLPSTIGWCMVGSTLTALSQVSQMSNQGIDKMFENADPKSMIGGTIVVISFVSIFIYIIKKAKYEFQQIMNDTEKQK